MDYKSIIKTILAFIATHILDEDNLAINLQLIAEKIAKPIVFVYVCGTYVADIKDAIVERITPELPTYETARFWASLQRPAQQKLEGGLGASPTRREDSLRNEIGYWKIYAKGRLIKKLTKNF